MTSWDLGQAENQPERLRIGVPQEYNLDGISEDVLQAWSDALTFLESRGAEIVPVSLPHTEHALPAYYVIAPAEASSNLARYDGIRYGTASFFILYS
jgi:aspartyl-tRNA(Asn)/glutamyl-tRNA(Gln) amidotransferase subunit A